MNARATQWRRSVLIGGGLAVVMIAIGAIGFLTRDKPAPTTPVPGPVELSLVPGGAAVESPSHGPWRRDGGRSAGFAHDALGAAIAASNIAPRITPAAGIEVAEATLAQQCYGDTTTAITQLRAALPRPNSPSQDALVPRALYYRVLAGDATGEQVVVSLLAETPQARVLGGLSRVDATLRWSDGDWRLRVPLPRPSVQDDTAGYTLLGWTS
ncbi:hypothetical protein [Pseudonocardia nigra]|uniref:hypothetical protein n=1 Tax=Pseudonocardia nigra TaxID=1921578 RepID=UPI001C604A01|nr:hypothetical protein [Pseudonocardia nigra]